MGVDTLVREGPFASEAYDWLVLLKKELGILLGAIDDPQDFPIGNIVGAIETRGQTAYFHSYIGGILSRSDHETLHKIGAEIVRQGVKHFDPSHVVLMESQTPSRIAKTTTPHTGDGWTRTGSLYTRSEPSVNVCFAGGHAK